MEQQVIAQGWRLAVTPADADVLAICGSPGRELTKAVAQIWDQLPDPRAKVQVDLATGVGPALRQAAEELSDVRRQREDSRSRPATPVLTSGDEGQSEMDHSAMDHGSGGGMDHAAMGHGSHDGMDMSPGGIPLAQGGEDRDGLEMDVLHLRLGPVLAYWPGGLTMRCSLQGDVIVQAEAELVDADRALTEHPDVSHAGLEARSGDRAAHRLDSVVNVLALAGWEGPAARTRQLRDSLLSGGDAQRASAALQALRRQVARSRMLRWSLRGVGVVTPEDVERHRLPGRWLGDTHDRLFWLLNRVGQDLAGPQATPSHVPGSAVAHGHKDEQDAAEALGMVPHLVTGLDLATARLMVASLDLFAFEAARSASHV